MSAGNLSELIASLEYGTKLHISVVFLDRYGNRQTQLPFHQQIHKCPMCDLAKTTPAGYSACVRCRNTVLKWVIRRKKALCGLCAKGVFEYCHPVLRGTEVAAVVFIGNILTEDPRQKARLRKHFQNPPLETMEKSFSAAGCRQTAVLVENYIHFLLDRYGESCEAPANALIGNIKNYLQEMLLTDFSIGDIAAVFNYNPKYLGRLFKTETGYTIREYSNVLKIERAKGLLARQTRSISDISSLSGYNNLTHFNRVFKKVTGQSPQEYRKASGATVGGEGLGKEKTRFYEAQPKGELTQKLMELSANWEAENSTYGYRKNAPEDIAGNRVFLAERDGRILGYLLGHQAEAAHSSSIMEAGTPCFEIEELYVVPDHRSEGLGRLLFGYAEQTVAAEGIGYLMLTTATKDYKRVLKFYIEEKGMKLWSARLFKKIYGDSF